MANKRLLLLLGHNLPSGIDYVVDRHAAVATSVWMAQVLICRIDPAKEQKVREDLGESSSFQDVTSIILYT